ncbi:MAG: hypothetical protein ACLFQK_10675 [Fibrobacterota bacterium]
MLKKILMLIVSASCTVISAGIDADAVLKGFSAVTQKGQKLGERKTVIRMEFIGKPTSYYHGFNQADTALEFEFYDAGLHKYKDYEGLDDLPFRSTEVFEDSVDLNKDIKGIRPDVRDVVRIRFKLFEEVEFEVYDEYNRIIAELSWNTDPKKNIRYIRESSKKRKLYLGIAGGATAGIVAAIVASAIIEGTPEEEDDAKTELPPIGEPPGHP